MISKSFIALALSVLALTSSVNAAAIPLSARQGASADLKLPSFHLPQEVPSLVGSVAGGFLSGLEAATPAAPPATSAVSARSAPTDVFARQAASADLRLPSFHLPQEVPSLVGSLAGGFLSGLEAATPAAPPATSAVSARSAPTDVFARQAASADLKLSSFKLPPGVGGLLDGAASVGASTFASVVGVKAASEVFAPAATTASAVSARSAPTDVFARQAASADLKLSSFKLPPGVGGLLNGAASVGANTFASVVGVKAASEVFAPAATTASAVSARSAPTDVFARQDASADLKLPSIHLPPSVGGLLNGAASVGANTFASVVGVQAASQIFAPAATASAA